MDENKSTRAQRSEQMHAHVTAYRESGKSRKQYCAEHDIKLPTMNYWCAKASRANEREGFAQLEISSAATIDLHYPNGVRLSLPVGTPLAEVAACIHLY